MASMTSLAIRIIALVLYTSTWTPLATANSSGCVRTGHEGFGTLTSPHYPRSYYSDQSCEWMLQVDHRKLIKFSFKDPFHLETSSDCSYDYVMIEQIQQETGTVVRSQKYCGVSKPSDFVSETSSVRVKFRSDGSNTYAGFGLEWKEISKGCDEQLYGNAGEISYPDTDAETCHWNISADRPHIVMLEFLGEFNLGVQDDVCIGDTLEVFDVMNNGTLVQRGSWCGNNRPMEIVSFQPRITISLKRKGPANGKEFSIKWTTPSYCSSEFNNPQGYIMSRNYPSDELDFQVDRYYTEEPHCQWIIVIPQDTYLVLNINISRESDCQSLKIMEAVENDLEVTKVPHPQWCLSASNTTDSNVTSWHTSTLTSFSNYVFLEYQHRLSDIPDVDFFNVYNMRMMPDFYATWTRMCGGQLSDIKGNLSSPGYGHGEYQADEDCMWVIKGTEGHVTRLDFQTPFDIETSNDGSCSYDYVEILEGPSGLEDNGLVLKGRYCGAQPPPQFTASSGHDVVVRFRSDHAKQGAGFSATWDASCGDVYTSLQGNLTSLGFPSSYPDNFDCRWEIQVPDGHAIQLSFTEPFSIEENTDCDADYLEIYDYTQNGILSKLGRWCGQNMPPLQTSLTSRMLLLFHSDHVKNNVGFQAQWTSGNFSNYGCGKELQTPSGTFSSPGFPEPYPNNIKCRWEIHAGDGQRVKLEFGSTFDLEMDNDGCSYDSVEVQEALPNGKMTSYGKWCSVRQIPVFYTTSRLVVLFSSDRGKSGQGFSASWESEPECGANITGKAGHLLSPNFPSNYPERTECRWEIVPDGEDFTLHFNARFDLEADSDCRFDYLEIHRANEVVGRWCGSDTPPDITSGGETLRVIFKSDKSTTGKGFLATLN